MKDLTRYFLSTYQIKSCKAWIRWYMVLHFCIRKHACLWKIILCDLVWQNQAYPTNQFLKKSALNQLLSCDYCHLDSMITAGSMDYLPLKNRWIDTCSNCLNRFYKICLQDKPGFVRPSHIHILKIELLLNFCMEK